MQNVSREDHSLWEELSLYGWSPVLEIWIQLLHYIQKQHIAPWSNPMLLNCTPSVQWSFPLKWAVWPDWAIYWTLGNFSKPLATINLPKSLTFFGNFCKDVKILNFSNEIIFGQLFGHLATFYLSHWQWVWVLLI